MVQNCYFNPVKLLLVVLNTMLKSQLKNRKTDPFQTDCMKVATLISRKKEKNSPQLQDACERFSLKNPKFNITNFHFYIT